MPNVTVESMAAAGDVGMLRAAGGAHAQRIRAVAAKVCTGAGCARVEGRVALVQGILQNTRDPIVAAACVKELEEARSQVDRISKQKGLGDPDAGFGMGGAPEGDELEAIRAANRAQYGMGAPLDLQGAFQGAAGNLIGAAVKGVTLKTTVTPEMRYAPGLPGQPSTTTNASGGPGEFILGLLKPEVILETPVGITDLAPYGKPTANYFWPAVVVTVVGIGTLLYFAAAGIKAKTRGR